jgi:hypothetical protein
MGRTCSSHGKEEEFTQGYGRKTRSKETTKKT